MSALPVGPETQPEDPEALELPELDTRDRLWALTVDPRANFLPATHMEKNWALVLLDYLDLDDTAAPIRHPHTGHPARTARQLNEVFWHQRNLRKDDDDPRPGIEVAQKTLRSVAFVFGDFLVNALTSKAMLKKLGEDAAACPNPKVTLAEELGLDHIGLPAFARYLDLGEVRRSGFAPVSEYDPLHTIEVRRDVLEPGRNKYIEDEYTGARPGPEVSERIRHVANSLTIGTLRTTIVRGNINIAQAAVRDQENRIEFWAERLREARAHGAAREIASIVLTGAGLDLR